MCVDRKRSRWGVRPPHISAETSALITKAGFQTQSLLRSKCLLIKKKSQACKFWFVCTRCLGQGSRRAESITIGMWTWLLRRLRKSHRPMIKNSVQASLQAHHSGCPHKGTVNLFKKVEGGGLKKKKKRHSSGTIFLTRLHLGCLFLRLDTRVHSERWKKNSAPFHEAAKYEINVKKMY